MKRIGKGNRDLRKTKGELTRQRILHAAANLASKEGLGAITFQRLRRLVGISESGVVKHFQRKAKLQEAVINYAWQRFREAVIEPSKIWSSNLERLYAMCVNWLNYVEEPVFDGGCFFCTVSLESRNRDQYLRSQLRSCMQGWLDYLTMGVNLCIREGSLPVDTDPHAFAFQLHCLLMGANWKLQFFDDRLIIKEVMVSIEETLNVDLETVFKVRGYEPSTGEAPTSQGASDHPAKL